MSTNEQRAQVEALAAKGLAPSTISKKVKVPLLTVYEWVPRFRVEDARLPEMARLHDQGLSYEAIGKRFGVSKQRVGALLGPMPRHGGKGDRRCIDVIPGTWEAIEALAAGLGLRKTTSPHAGSGSVPRLLEALGRGELDVTWRGGYGPDLPGDE